MKIAPLKVTDPWFARISADGTVSAETLRDVPVESIVEMELVELLHGGPEDNYRPYLHLRGELTEVTPSVELPYGVTELALRRGSGLPLDAFYDFSPEQLGDLVSKGYFTPAFRVPEGMADVPWQLPNKADFLIVAPEFSDEAPVVFMNVHNQSELGLDEVNSGYELSGYFPDFNAEAEAQQAEAESAVDGPLRGTTAARDVFSDVAFEDHRPETYRPAAVALAEQRTAVPDSVFNRLVEEIEGNQPVAAESVYETAEPQQAAPGSAADVYLTRVAPGVDRVLNGVAAEAEADADQLTEQVAPAEEDLGEIPVTADGFLDLSAPEEDLAPAPVATGESTAEAHRRAVAKRNARIQSELAEAEESPASEAEAEPER